VRGAITHLFQEDNFLGADAKHESTRT
jgi:hypothetical protein